MSETAPIPEVREQGDILTPAQRKAFEELRASVEQRARRAVLNGNVDDSLFVDECAAKSEEAFLLDLHLRADIGGEEVRRLLELEKQSGPADN